MLDRRLAAVLVLALLSAGAGGRDEDFSTPAEQSGYRTTPRYAETLAYARRLVAAAPGMLELQTFGKSGEGRDLVVVVASKDGVFDPARLHRAGRPIVLVQNAIHAGEMDGKDACLALLRDMAVTKRSAALLERVVLLVIPIYNADGHERFGAHNRINQNGPQQAGFRTQAQNLNLNRDYMKADAPETRAFLRLWERWQPDLFIDTHVTDGADFQYDTTYAVDTGPDVFPPQAEWKRTTLLPAIERAVSASGHVIGPYVSFKDELDPAQGLTLSQDPPRFSTGYVNLRNRPALLLEMHMLKDYRTRVTGSYEFLRAVLEVVNRDADRLLALNREADAATVAAGKRFDPAARFPLKLEPDGSSEPVPFRGYRFGVSKSEISGSAQIAYVQEPVEITLPRQSSLRVTLAVAPPLAYIVPAQWKTVIEVLQAHGLRLLETARAWEGEVSTYRCEGPVWLERPFEGRQVLFSPGESRGPSKPSPGSCSAVREKLAYPAGSVVVALDQPAAKVAIHWLEPEAPDSALLWGFFNSIFEQKEYAEGYVLEKLAREMLAKDPALKEEFERRVLQDPTFAASPEARLSFFYRRSPWWDARLGLYPVGRLASLDGIPLKP